MDGILTLVLISYNRKKLVRKALKSMLDQTIKPKEIIVVDNNSTDGTKEMIRKEFPKIKLIILPKNEGLCYASNVGFKNATGKYVGFVENDMTLSKNWVEEVIKEFKRNPDVGAVCPYFLHWSKHGWIDCEFETEDDYLYMLNGCYAVRKDIFKGDLHDSKYFLYAQEEELSARIFNLGYKIKRIRTAKTFHRPIVKGRVKNDMWIHYNIRNNFWNLWTYYSLVNVIVFTPAYFLNFLLQEDPFSISFFDVLKAFLDALWSVPHCLRKRSVVNINIYKSPSAYYIYRKRVKESHFHFNWKTGEIHPKYLERIIR